MPKKNIRIVPIRVILELSGDSKSLMEFELVQDGDNNGALGERFDTLIAAGAENMVLCEFEVQEQQAHLFMTFNQPDSALLRTAVHNLLFQIVSLCLSPTPEDGEDDTSEEADEMYALPRKLRLSLLGARSMNGVPIR
jgi:hypothetical protein